MVEIHTTKRRLLMPILFMQCLGALCVLASSQSLPAEWWTQDSPENVLIKAQLITSNLDYFHGIKTHSIGDKNVFLEFFKRKTASGKIETKIIETQLIENHPRVSVFYDLENGKYDFMGKQLIKSEFETAEGRHQRMALNFNHPYNYKMQKSEWIGTNNCIVVARIISLPFFDAVIAESYKKLPNDWNYPEIKDLMIKGYPFEEDYYIRKSDGVIIGFRDKNKAGFMSSDLALCDIVQINVPIPDQEFILPAVPFKNAHSYFEWNDIVAKLVTAEVTEIHIKYRGEILSRHYKVLAVIAIPSVLFLSVILWLELRRRNAKVQQG
jgi:hypothetical protein